MENNSPETARLLERAPPELFGDYRILREIGRGGMGVVYEAEQISLGRRVALKVLPATRLADERQRRRFEREARAAARLHHTNIVPVFAVGVYEGTPYYAMQLIQGLGLDAVLAELIRQRGAPVARPAQAASLAHSLRTGTFRPGGASEDVTISPDDKVTEAGPDPVTLSPPHLVTLSPSAGALTYWQSVARIGVQVADALEHAHRQGVLHRDVKPSNLLLDTVGVAWVTDFGLAKAAGQEDLTATGDVLGTLRYMPPEAFEGKSDARSDVYSLALTLFELLALRPAFDAPDQVGLLRQAAAAQVPRLDRLAPGVPRDLVTVVHKATERDPAQRYQSAGELAADLQRFLDDEPVRARRQSAAERCRRWCRQNPAVAGLSAAVALALVLGTAASSFFALRAGASAREARRNEAEAVRRKEEADAARAGAEAARRETRQNLYFAEMNLAREASGSPGGIGRLLDVLNPWRPATAGEPDLRGWEWYYLRGAAEGPVARFRHRGAQVQAAAWSPDGLLLASAGSDGTVRLWEADTGRPLHVLRAPAGVGMAALAWSPNGGLLAGGGSDGRVRLWDVRSGRQAAVLGSPGAVSEALAWSPDGRRLVSGHSSGAVLLWEVASLRSTSLQAGSCVWGVAWSPDSKRFAAGTIHSGIHVWDAATGRQTAHLPADGYVRGLSWGPDSRLLAAGEQFGDVKVWDVLTGKVVLTLKGHTHEVRSVSWGPQGTLASASRDRTIRLWRLDAGKLTLALRRLTGKPPLTLDGPPVSLRGLTSDPTWVAWSPDGRRLLSADGGVIRLWAPRRGDPHQVVLKGHEPGVRCVAWGPGGRLATGGWDNVVRLWDADTGRQTAALEGHSGGAVGVAWSPDGRRLATLAGNGTVRIWEDGKPGPVRTLTRPPAAWSLSWSPDGRLLAAGGDGGTIFLWDAQSGAAGPVLSGHTGAVDCVAWDASGSRLASASADGTVALWDVAAGRRTAVLRGHTDSVMSVTWCRDGRRLVSASNDGTLRVWDAAGGRTIQVLRGHTAGVRPVLSSPDGRRLASGSVDGVVKLWDADSGREILTLYGHQREVSGLSWSRDGLRLAAGSLDGTVRIWDATPGCLAERSAGLEPALEHRLGLRPGAAADLRLRAEVLARRGRWQQAAADWDRAADGGDPPLLHAGWWLAGPFSAWEVWPGALPDPFEPLPVSRPQDALATRRGWVAVPATRDGFLDLDSQLPPASTGQAFALARVYAPRARAVQAVLDSSGPRRRWLNGRPLPAEERVLLPLEAGWNTLLLGVDLGPEQSWLSCWLDLRGQAAPAHD